MRYLEEFRGAGEAQAVLGQIRGALRGRRVRIMEVCGGHTMALWRYGLPGLLQESVDLLSGPGCPVCVTPNAYLDRAVALARHPGTIVVTFGDLMRVPGSSSTLLAERARGGDIRPVYSPRDALDVARAHPERTAVFLGIGFETTAPTVAAALISAREAGLANFRMLSALKTMPQALRALAGAGEVRLDGLILPGHVTAVTGAAPFHFLAEEFRIPCVVSGFEPLDLLQSLWMLARQVSEGRAEVEIQYLRAARPQGNPRAREVLDRVFCSTAAQWRGMGAIPGSGLALREEWSGFAAEAIPVEVEAEREHPGCRCGDVIRGAVRPEECSLFAGPCRPESPAGACMVSEEGACAAHYRYRHHS
ncbi:MAG: hydrogenase formation protein HypD [Candidatus Zixiibacteriota bacterium]|nr:MAG: hydrogenase formation protein HypD [candidate division Zixibacteria bacterium]